MKYLRNADSNSTHPVPVVELKVDYAKPGELLMSVISRLKSDYIYIPFVGSRFKSLLGLISSLFKYFTSASTNSPMPAAWKI